MYDGEITNNEAFSDWDPGRGGGVSIWRGTFNMYGGLISNNIANEGGGVYAGFSTVTVHNGEISGNNAYDGNRWSGGGGIYLKNSFFIMYGGEIISNDSLHGGSGIGLWSSHGVLYDGIVHDNNIVLIMSSTFSVIGGQLSDRIYDRILDWHLTDENRDRIDSGSMRRIVYYRPYIHLGMAITIMIFKGVCVMIFLKKRGNDLQQLEQWDGEGESLS